MRFSQKAAHNAAFFVEIIKTVFLLGYTGKVVMLKSLAVLVFAAACGSARAAVPEPDVLINDQGMQVVINLPQTRLFLYQDGVLLRSFPVAVGKMLTKTPTGSFDVTGIYRDPSWHVPKSIQEEMRAQGKPVLTVVPPGDKNPLGRVFIRFGEPGLGLGIHGTNAPSSVPGFRSHGCVRMKNPDVAELSGLVSVGAAVTVTYQAILLNLDDNGQLWMTAYRNLYQHDDVSMPLLAQVLLGWQREHGVAIFGKRVNQALAVRDGKPVCLTCRSANVPFANRNLTALRWLSSPPDSEPTVATRSNASQPEVAHPERAPQDHKSTSVEQHSARAPI